MSSASRRLLLIRHGATRWNRQRRIQGRADLPLDPEARAALRGARLPEGWRDARWYVSPLTRAQETARALGARQMTPVAALVEMDWGAWQGQTLAALRDRDPEAMRRNEARGLDFRPDGGESPREVRARLAHWLATLADDGPPLAVVTHKGVIRAALSLATGWDLRADYPRRLRWECGHAFAREAGGALTLLALNIPLGDAA